MHFFIQAYVGAIIPFYPLWSNIQPYYMEGLLASLATLIRLPFLRSWQCILSLI